jgi:DNA-binding transcriptional LysR family regulator
VTFIHFFLLFTYFILFRNRIEYHEKETIVAKMEIIQALPYLKTFVVVVELESFAQAALALGVSTPSVSKQINKLEEIVGLQLLVRTTRKMALTDAGARFYEQCKRVLEEVEVAEEIVTGMHREPTGRLHVVAARYFAKKFIVPHVKKFQECYPQVFLNLELAERMPDIEKEGVDVVIGMSVSAESSNIIQKRIMWTRYAFSASPAYLEQYGMPKVPQDLLHHRYLTHSMRKPNSVLSFPGGEAVTVKPFLQVNDAETLLDLTMQGMGIMKTHEYVVAEAIVKGHLVEILKPYSKEMIPIFVAYPQRRILSRKIRCFIDFVLSHLPEAEVWAG